MVDYGGVWTRSGCVFLLLVLSRMQLHITTTATGDEGLRQAQQKLFETRTP
jgi:hypothetical protein